MKHHNYMVFVRKIGIYSALVLAVFLFVRIENVKASFSETVYLSPGWNAVSTPRVLESHSFSAIETSENFDIFIVNPNSVSGWSTLSEIGQTDFVPLYGYFINNKTNQTQSLTFKYKQNTQPNERLFERNFTKTGWYLFGISNATYSKPQYADMSDINNPISILDSMSGFHSSVIDFTYSERNINTQSTKVGESWGSAVEGDLNSLPDFRDTKAYGVYINKENAVLSGFQNNVYIPFIYSLSPALTIASSSDFILSINGYNFDESSEIYWQNQAQSTTYISPVELRTKIFKTQISTSSTKSVSVFNPGLNGGTSTIANFIIKDIPKALGSVNINVKNLIGTSTLNMDQANPQEITKFGFSETGGQENAVLSSISVQNNGTTLDGDLQDIQLVDKNGIVVATAQQSNKIIVFNLATPYVIRKATTTDFIVRTKIIGGPSRTIQFIVRNNFDVVISGESTGVSFLPLGTFPTSAINTVFISSGSINFNKDASTSSAAVAPGTNGAVIAKFFAKPAGENMELRQVNLNIVSSSPIITGSVVIKVNGASVWSGSPNQFSGSFQNITLATFPTLIAGQNNYITVECNVASGAPSGANISASMNLLQVKRFITNDLWTPTTVAATGNTIFVQVAALKITNLATPVAQTVVAGTSGVILANIELNAGSVLSGEDISVSKIIISDVTTGVITDFGNLVLFDAAGNQLVTTASTAVNASTTSFNLVTPILVPKTGSITLTLKGDVISGNSGTHRFFIAYSADIKAIGVSSGSSVVSIMGFGSGQALTVLGSGTLSLSAVTGGSAAPSNDQNVLVGQTAVPVFAFKLTAQNEPIKITSLKLTATGTLNTINDLINLKLYRDNDSVPFATAGQMTMSALNTLEYTWLSIDNLLPAAIQPGTPVTIYVKADIGSAGAVFLGDKFRFQISPSTNITAKGASSGAALNQSSIIGTPSVNSYTSFAPFSVSLAADTPIGSQVASLAAGTSIARIKVINNGSAKITIKGIKFTDSGSHAGLTTTYKLLYSDQNSTNYTANTASSTNGKVDFSDLSTQGTTFTIDGGSYRYVSLVLNTPGSIVSGDNFQLSISSHGDVTYVVAETDLGYDSNNTGTLSGNSATLFAEGKPSLGTISKQ